MMSGALSSPNHLERAHVRAIGPRLVPVFPSADRPPGQLRYRALGHVTLYSYQWPTKESSSGVSQANPSRDDETAAVSGANTLPDCGLLGAVRAQQRASRWTARRAPDRTAAARTYISNPPTDPPGFCVHHGESDSASRRFEDDHTGHGQTPIRGSRELPGVAHDGEVGRVCEVGVAVRARR
jgi:hypothetical protein